MFSELSLITAETGLSFDTGRTALYGELRGFGVTLADTGDRYELKVFCLRPFEREADVAAAVIALNEGLPKNSLLSQSCEVGYVLVTFDKYSFLQENVVYLTEFLDKLTGELEELGLTGAAYSFPRVKAEPAEELPKDAVKIRLGFDMRSVAGAAGALVGAAAMIVISILSVNADVEMTVFGLRFEIATYILSGLTAAVVLADYRFIAGKLDAFGVLVCPVLTVASVILSGLGAGAKVCAKFAGVPFLTAVVEMEHFLAVSDTDGMVSGFIVGYITRGVALAVLVCIIICTVYFERHPDETVKTEKTVSKNGGAGAAKKR